MTPQSSVNFPKTGLKGLKTVETHTKKRVMRAVFALPGTAVGEYAGGPAAGPRGIQGARSPAI